MVDNKDYSGYYATQYGNHVYNHAAEVPVKVNVKIEKNSKGYNWEATVVGALSVDEAMALLKEADSRLRVEYGTQL